MCVHYELETTEELLLREASIDAGRLPEIGDPRGVPTKKVAWPKTVMPSIVSTPDGVRRAELRWGIWPKYARDRPQFVPLARDDSLLTKATWKKSAAARRCLIPMTAFYEWAGPDGAKWECRFSLRSGWPFFVAAIWDSDPDGCGTSAFSVVTTNSNPLVAEANDRMPVMLTPTNAKLWLGHEPLADADLLGMCVAYPAAELVRADMPKPTRPKKPADLFE